MPQGKGTYGSKVGRPPKKKLYDTSPRDVVEGVKKNVKKVGEKIKEVVETRRETKRTSSKNKRRIEKKRR